MSTIYKDLGPVTAYAYAVAGGYVGTEAQFEALLGNIAEDLSNIENLTVTVTTLPAGSSATASYADGVLSLGIPKGDTGEQGEQGEQGDEGVGIGAVTKTGTSGNVDTYTVYSNESTPQALGTFTVTNSDVVSDGNYPNMTVGNAEQLVATVGIEDKVPYLFRTSGGAADIGDRETDTVVGGSVAWNQLMKPPAQDQSGVDVDISYIRGVDGSFTFNGTATSTGSRVGTACANSANHIYYIAGNPIGDPSNIYFSSQSYGWDTSNTGAVIKNLSTNSTWYYVFRVTAGTTYNNVKFKPVVIDLTQMFGSAVADYIYALESGTAGAGVAWLKKYCPKMFSTYQAYNAGELLSVKTTAHETVGFNAWDEEWELGSLNNATGEEVASTTRIRSKNYIPIIGGARYFINLDYGTGCCYDANKNFIGVMPYSYATAPGTYYLDPPADVCYFRFALPTAYGTTYKHDICINLHWDGERDGEYEPYVKHTYPLDSDLELRGIPKLDAGNNLYYDGDTYESDGTVTRRYAEVDLGSLEWTATGSQTEGYSRFISNVLSPIGEATPTGDTGKVMCAKYVAKNGNDLYSQINGITLSSNGRFVVYDSAYAQGTASAFGSAMSGVKAVYAVATPTTESADPFQNPQIVDDFGTESYVDSRTVPVPVGHTTTYAPNLRAKLEMSPDSPADGDGDYIVRQTSGENEYVKLVKELPTLPTTDGSYTLSCTVASGTPTLSWVANE